MSMKIDKARIADGTLTYNEAMYLKKRGKLPRGYEMPEDPKDEADEEPTPVLTKVTPIEEQTVPTIEANGGIVDDDGLEEDYLEGWNNDQRRAELSKRGLSVNGNKDALIARLRRSDVGELIDGDESEV